MMRELANSTMKIAAIVIVFVLLLMLNFFLWKRDYRQEKEIIGLQKERTLQQKKNATISKVNSDLKQKIDRLKQGNMEMIEEEARNNFGMVGKGETYYHFEDKDKLPKKTNEQK